MKVLILWDIDLTLVHAGPIGRELYADAFRLATGRTLEHVAPMSGRLDPDIFRDTLAAHGLDAADHPFPRFAEALAAGYASRTAELGRRGQALPGAAAALAALAEEPAAIQTVLTGNIPAVARSKLAAFDLDRHLDLSIGAYGPDDHVRSALVPLAQRRAGARHGAVFDRANTVVIGDTANDVAAAREGGARAIAVASGRTPAADLRAAGADAVLDDLCDTALVVRLTMGR
ncbi:MAG TPA: haloacid dehalogenase-like hydrolase [Candidatus Dormibacteraeota bacterium]|nr:haloacid dehalogenase-like hydrolase [Candidatus Dormibacteraeota bacterium]